MYYRNIPTDGGQVIELAGNNEIGLSTYGAALKITAITPAEIAAQLAAFSTDNANYLAARTARQAASDELTAGRANLLTWIAAVKSVLVPYFGAFWNAQWVQVGFANASVAIPSRQNQQWTLAGQMITFLTKNPSYEDAALEVTAAQGTVLRGAITTALATYTAEDMALRDLGTAWDTSYGVLVGTMRRLLKFLQGSLAKDDPRWLKFGYTLPSVPATPGQPLNVAAQVDGAGNVIVTCDAVPLADRYRFRGLIVGVETELRLLASSKEPLGSIPGVLPGQMLKLILQAANGNLQGVASEPILFTVPAPGAGTTAGAVVAAKVTEPTTPVTHYRNGNGKHTNGHELPARA